MPVLTGTQNMTLNKKIFHSKFFFDFDFSIFFSPKELKITPILDKLLEYKRNWIQRVNRMPRNRLPRVMKHYSPTGRRNYGRPLKRLLNT